MKTMYELGSGKVEVLCDLAGSYRLADRRGQTVVLVKCDRLDLADNARGLALAEFLAKTLNEAVKAA